VITLGSARRAADAFRLPGAITRIEAHGDGLIHDTFVVFANAREIDKQFILQRINQRVFTNPAALMENIERVIMHVQHKAAQAGRDPGRSIPSLVCTKAGQTWLHADDEAWRMLRYVEGTMTVDRHPSIEQAHEIGLTFGRLLDDLDDFSPQSLLNVLPGYRDTQRYLDALWQALADNHYNRAKDAREEITFVEARVEQTLLLQSLQRSRQLPLRVIHGDTKLNNVLLDIESGAGVCAIDLDTVMPGLLLHDIGDCVREALVGLPQRTATLSDLDRQFFEAIVSGFVSSQMRPLVALEVESLVSAVSSITLELGARFLCDYLSGDAYFRTTASEENLLRARQHFRLQKRIEASQSELQASVLRCMEST
jgi:Ser/Thr protein kinase RdoA (MazF antagonist)